MAKDWDWRQGEDVKDRQFRIVQSRVHRFFPEILDPPFHRWMQMFSSRPMYKPMKFWYDQFLGKLPQIGAPTPWHQDEAYWGRRLNDKGITCWLALEDVRPRPGLYAFCERRS